MRRSLRRSWMGIFPGASFRAGRAAVVAAALFFVPAVSVVASPQERKPESPTLSLRDCIARALAENLEVSIEALNPAIGREAVKETREKFIPTAELGFYGQNRTILGTWGVEGTSYRYKYDQYTFNLSQNLITGGTLSLSFANAMTDTARAYTVINPSYYSEFQLRLIQPLLKGFGPTVNRIERRRADNRLDILRAALKTKLLSTVYDIETAYWNLVYSRENLQVLELSLEQGREILRRNREGARVGTKSAVEVLSAETEVAGWEDNVLSARRAVEQAEDLLRRAMNLPPGDPSAPPAPVVPADRPEVEKRTVSYEEALAAALRERPEILTAERELATAGEDVTYYRNQLLPEINLDLSVFNPGQSGVRYKYENDDPFNGKVIDVIRGSRMDSLRNVFRDWQKSWTAGVTFTLPMANVFSRASVAKARLQNEQAVLKLEDRKTAIGFEIAAAFKELAAAERKIASTAAYRALLEKRLEAEIQRYQVGLVGSEWLFTYQRQLAQARTAESRALVDLKIAQAALDKAMGASLKTKGIKFRDYDF